MSELPLTEADYDVCLCCDRARVKHSFCNRHYLRWRRHGDPLAGGRERPGSWFDLVALDDHGLIWIGTTGKGSATKKRGPGGQYGQYNDRLVHRLAYEHFVGPIPEGFHVDHLPECPKICVTPEHLQALSPSNHHRLSWQRGESDGGWSVRR